MRFVKATAFAAALLLFPPVLRAQDCGSTITTNTTLTGDIGPCQGDGLIIGRSGITLDLNGYHVEGSGDGTGINIGRVGGVVIKNGTVFNFGVGLSAGRAAGTITISGLSIYSADIGVACSQATCRIANNLIVGTSSASNVRNMGGPAGPETVSNAVRSLAAENGLDPQQLAGTGILVAEGNYRIKLNQISGYSRGARLGQGAGGIYTFSENEVSGNIVGLELFTEGTVRVRCNMITSNVEDGILSGKVAAGEITNNHVDSNGRSGIRVNGRIISNLFLEDNSTASNGLYGIEIADTAPRSTGLVSVVDNLSQGNSIDVFWDGAARACFLNNTFDTSSPPVLPSSGCFFV